MLLDADKATDRGSDQVADSEVDDRVDISIILVNYNARAMLADCLDSIRADSLPPASAETRADGAPWTPTTGSTRLGSVVAEVVVVDNASRDGSVELVREHFPEYTCIANQGNLGYTRANNQGLAVARGRHVMLLNNDTVVRPGSLGALVAFLDAHPEAGAVSPKVLNPDGSVQGTFKSLPTPSAALWGRRSFLTRLFPNNSYSKRYLVYQGADFSRPFTVGSAGTCALAISRRALDLAGTLDEGYVMYWVDVDWCKAIWDCGLGVYIEPRAEVVHFEHSGGSRAGFWQNWRSVTGFHRGAYRYYRKHHVRSTWSVGNALAVVGLVARAALVLGVSESRWLASKLTSKPHVAEGERLSAHGAQSTNARPRPG